MRDRWFPALSFVTFIATAGSTVGASPLAAQEPGQENFPAPGDAIESLALEDLLGSVSAVSRRKESVLKAPATVTVVDRSDIELSAAENVPELLRTVPGVQVVRVGPGNYLVSVRGLGGVQANNLVVLIDGIPVNSRADGTVDWNALPVHLNEIDRIEVVRGPVGAIWGANAITGVINIVTRTTGDASRGGFTTGVDGSLRPIASGSAAVADSIGNLGWRLSLFSRHDETGAAPPGNGDDRDDREFQPAADMIGGRARLRYDITDRVRVDGDLGATLSQRSRLDHLSFTSAAEPGTLVLGRVAITAEDLPLSIDSGSLWLRSRWLTVDVFGDHPEEEIGGFTQSGLNALDGDVGFDLHFRLPFDIGIGTGANAGLALVSAPFMHPDEDGKTRSSLGAYVNGDVEFFESVRAFAGLRVDRTATMQNPELSYRLGALWYASTMSVRLSADSAVREPTYAEVGARLIDPTTGLILLEGNPALRPPKIQSLELAVIVAPLTTLRLQPTLFVQQAADIISEDFSPVVKKTFINDDDAELMVGGEFEAEWNFLQDYFLLGRFGSVVWPAGDDDNGEGGGVGGEAENSRVTAYAGLRGRFFSGRLGAALGAGYATGRVYQLETGIPPRILDVDTGLQGFVEVASEAQPAEDLPMFVTVKLRVAVPGGVVEAPFPGASAPATRALLGIEYRP